MKKIGSCIGVLLSTFLFAICGYLVAKYGIGELENLTTGERLFKISLCFVAIYVAIIVQIIIHEAGHLIFGQLSGYEFSSFRIFSFMWIKKNGKIAGDIIAEKIWDILNNAQSYEGDTNWLQIIQDKDIYIQLYNK